MILEWLIRVVIAMSIEEQHLLIPYANSLDKYAAFHGTHAQKTRDAE